MTVYIASHKHQPLHVPEGYLPLRVGAALDDSLKRDPSWRYDDEGFSISNRNDTFCELTGMYWIYKNTNDDVVGLVHYRRYLASPTANEPLSNAEINSTLLHHDCIMAEKCSMTNAVRLISCAANYRDCHSSIDLRILRDTVKKAAREYLPSFDTCMDRTWMRPCNIIICPKSIFDAYCDFAFDLLAHCDHVIEPAIHQPAYQHRVFGFLAERLLNVFVEHHKLDVTERPFIDPMGDKRPTAQVDGETRPQVLLDALPKGFKPRYAGLDYSPVFDAKFYLSNHNDVLEAFGCNPEAAFDHFLSYGLKEQRIAHPKFSLRSYVNSHPELAEECADDPHAWIAHYLRTKRTELFAFGFEQFDYSGKSPLEILQKAEGICIDGTRRRSDDVLKALRHAARQGAID